jgi:hypothetical protein
MAILPSNVGQADQQPPPAPKRDRSVLVGAVLLVAILLVLGGAVALLVSTNQPRLQAAGVRALPTLAPTTVAARQPVAPGAPLPRVNGISCDALESTLLHIHVHLGVFVDGAEIVVPYGIGIGEPWQVTNTRLGPFVADGSCFYWIHTHTEDGVVHVESPIRRDFTLGDFFAIWQEPLSPTQVGSARGEVITYVNGQRISTNPADITLASRQLIQLNIGRDVPPQPFEFAPGD